MVNAFDAEYHRLGNLILNKGVWKNNKRTKKRCLTILGEKCVYDLSTGKFPALTTKKLLLNAMIGELLGFIRAVDNAKDFRDLKCNFWNSNANESPDWLNNPNRKGEDDLGRIYGVQGRRWINRHGQKIDQLKNIVDNLNKGIDNRRLIMNYWNPGELEEMALPPCHDFYQFHILDSKLHLTMYQRSNDVPLGTPMNIASSSLLLILLAQITGFKPGTFTHMMGDVHLYEDQVELFEKQMARESYEAPVMKINPLILSLEDLDTWVSHKDFELIGYKHHEPIAFPFAA